MTERKKNLQDVVTAFLRAIDDSDGVITPIVEALEGQLLDKLDAIGAIVELFEAQEDGYKQRIEALKTRAEKAAKQRLFLIEWAESALRRLNMKSAKTPAGYSFEFKTFKASNIVDEDLLEARYMRHVPEKWEPNKAEILKALRAGLTVKGAELQVTEKLIIK